MSVLRKYFDAAVSSAITKAIVASSSIMVLFLLNAILGKAGFGTFMLALTIMRIFGLITSSGFSQLMLFRVSREAHSGPNGKTARRMLGNSLVYALLLSVLVAMVTLLMRNEVGRVASNPALADWLLAAGLIIPADVLRYVVASWYRALQRIRVAVLVRDGVPAMLLPVLLAAVWLTDGKAFTPELAGLVYGASALLPALALLIMHPPLLFLHRGIFSRWDVFYGAKMSLTQLAAQPARQIDIVLVGFLASAGVTAEYVLASRLAQILMMSKSFLAQLLVPRIGYRLGRSEVIELVAEYNAVRYVSLCFAILAGMIYVAFPLQIMDLFGEYTQGAVLIALVAAMLVRVGVGPSGNYLAQAGYAGWTLWSTISGFVSNVLLAVWWIPEHGAMGAAMAFFVAVLIQNAISVGAVWYFDRFPALNAGTGLVLLTVTTLLLGNAGGYIDGLVAVFGMTVVLMITASSNWKDLLAVWRKYRANFAINLGCASKPK